MKQLYYISVFLIILVASACILDGVAAAGSAQSFIRSHWIDEPQEVYCE